MGAHHSLLLTVGMGQPPLAPVLGVSGDPGGGYPSAGWPGSSSRQALGPPSRKLHDLELGLPLSPRGRQPTGRGSESGPPRPAPGPPPTLPGTAPAPPRGQSGSAMFHPALGHPEAFE